MKNCVIVLVEHLKGSIVDITYEMLGAGKKISDSFNIPLVALILGKDVSKLISNLGIADYVLVVDDERLEMPEPQLSAKLIETIYKQKEASTIILGCTNITSGIGPILAKGLDLPFINFCKKILISDGSILVTSHLYGGKILSEIMVEGGKGILGIYPGSFPLEEGKATKIPQVEEIEISDLITEPTFKRYIEPEVGDVDITKEDILVSVGRGIENIDNLSLAEDLISVLGGAIAASRPIIDMGWLPLTRQVGKSGMIVKPKLYFALGISGAPEHIEGMKNSELIIAINKDPSAPIFNIAHYGICGDLQEIVPVLVDKLKQK